MAVQLVGKIPERTLRPNVALDQFHVLKVEVVGRGVAMAVGDNGLQVLDQLGIGRVMESEALEAQGKAAWRIWHPCLSGRCKWPSVDTRWFS